MMPIAGFGPIGFPELMIILGILVLLFGARRIPELARGLGEGIRNFRTSLKGDEPGPDPGSKTEGSDGPDA